MGDLRELEEPVEPEDIEKLDEGVWKIQGSADLEDVAEELKIKLNLDDYDTFSGYICGRDWPDPRRRRELPCRDRGAVHRRAQCGEPRDQRDDREVKVVVPSRWMR